MIVRIESEQDGDAKAVDDARDDIAALVVGAEPVAIADGLEARELVGGGIAQLRAGRPGRRRGKAQAVSVRRP